MPKPDAQEGVEEEHEARREPGFGGGAVERSAVGPYREQLVPEAEIDAEIDQDRPGDERGRREDRPVIGGEDRGQEDGEQPGDAEQHAVEQHAVLLLRLIGVRVPQIEARHLRRAHLGGEGDGLPRLEVQPVHVGAVALQRLGAEAERRRHRGDAGSVELGPEHARIGQRVARRDQPAHDRLGGRVGQGEDEPARIGAGVQGLHRHAADIAVGAGRGLDLELVAAALIELALGGDVDLLLVGRDRDRLHRAGEPRRQEDERDESRTDERARAPALAARPGRRLPSFRGAQLHPTLPSCQTLPATRTSGAYRYRAARKANGLARRR